LRHFLVLPLLTAIPGALLAKAAQRYGTQYYVLAWQPLLLTDSRQQSHAVEADSQPVIVAAEQELAQRTPDGRVPNRPSPQVPLGGARLGVAGAYLDGRACFSSLAEDYSIELAADRSDVRSVLMAAGRSR
jgi:hypothetical protein